MKTNFFTVADEKNGYPFFSQSSFYAWIIYLNNPVKKYVRYSIETKQTILQLLNLKYAKEVDYKIELNLQNGYLSLQQLLEKQADKIQIARIYSTLPEYKNKYFFEMRLGKITHDNAPKLIFDNPIRNINFEILLDKQNKKVPKILKLSNVTTEQSNSHV